MLKHQPARGREGGPERERGFALLLVFALAASVAILVYLEIPRVAFERQRDKEALLIDRGEQYARAIELYARKTHKYPQSLDELEHGQSIRFLRRRYKDPMTGKDEWRLVHMSANGQYVDSKVHKAAGAVANEDSGPSVLASRIQGIGQSATLLPQDGQNVSAALQKRGSDRITPGSKPGSAEPGQIGSPDAPQDPSQPQNNTAQAGQAGATSGGLANSARFPFPGQQANDTQQQGNPQNPPPPFGSVLPPGQQDGANANSSNPGGSPQPPAMQAIQSILGTQHAAPAGAGGVAVAGGVGGGVGGTGGGQVGVGGGSALGAGLAGVATTVVMEGIRRYKEHTNYSEWEFLYDPKDVQGQGQALGQGAGNQQQGGAGNGTGGAPGAPPSFGGMGGGNPAPSGPAPKN